MLGHCYIVRESHVKTTMGYHHRPVKMAEMQNTETKRWRGCGAAKTLIRCGGGCKMEDSLATFLFTKLNPILPYSSAVASLSIYTN